LEEETDMKYLLSTLTALGALITLGIGLASAQFPGGFGGASYAPYPRSAPVSPYINLGANPNAFGLYGQTIPQLQQQQNNRLFQQQYRQLEAQVQPGREDEDLTARVNTTGHPVAYNYVSGYFNTMAPRIAPRPAGTGKKGTGR
jgi:hypothetical protein